MQRLLLAALFLFGLPGARLQAQHPAHPAHQATHASTAGPLALVPNAGQWEAPIRYQADVAGGRVWLEQDGLRMLSYDASVLPQLHRMGRRIDTTVTFQGHVLRLSWVGGNRSPLMQAQDVQPGLLSYFLGDDTTRWRGGLQAYSLVQYKNIYPHVDLQVTGSATGRLKYNLVLRPGADLQQVRLRYDGAHGLALAHDHLHIHTCLDTLVEHAPETYRITGKGTREDLPLRYVLHPDQSFGFEVPGWDGSSTLFIDPELIFSTYTGSLADNWGMTATYDEAGALYSGGVVAGPGYPTTTGAVQLVYGGGTAVEDFPGLFFNCDMAITKFSANGTQRLWATYLGGTRNEYPASMVVNAQNELFVLGATLSENFPVTNGCLDDSLNGITDITLSRINATGTLLLASTYLGGDSVDGINVPYFGVFPDSFRVNPLWYFYADDGRGEIILDRDGNVLIASCTSSPNFPVSTRYGTAYGGGDQDGVVAKLNSGLNNLLGATYIPGDSTDAAYSLKTNNRNEVYVTGGTMSPNGLRFPATAHQPARSADTTTVLADGFILMLDANLDTLLSGTYVGTANAYDQSHLIEIDSLDAVYVFGQSEGDWPVTRASDEDTVYSVANGRQFLARYDSLLTTRTLSTRWGTGMLATADITPTAFLVDACGNIYCTGWGGLLSSDRFNRRGIFTRYGSTNGLPVTADAFQSSTDGQDFYLIVFDPNARALQYATFFGQNDIVNIGSPGDHVDGGTCRFDKQGRVYHAVCASCGGYSGFPTTPDVVSRFNNSPNCNNAAFKFSFDLINFAQPQFVPRLQVAGCAPFPFLFENNTTTSKPLLTGSIAYFWDFGDTTAGVLDTSTLQEPTYTYVNAGIYRAKLAAYLLNEGCAFSDSIYQDIIVYEDTDPQFEVDSDSCSLQIAIRNLTTRGTIFHWQFGEGPGDTLRTIGPTSFAKTYGVKGLYTIFLTVNPGSPCSKRDSLVVQVGTPAVAGFTYTQDPCLPELSFSNISTFSDSYRWQFSNNPADTLRTNSMAPFTRVFAGPGIYPIKVVANPDSACPDSITQTIEVFALPQPAFEVISDSCTLTLVLENRSTRPRAGDVYRWQFGPNPADTLRILTPDPVSHTFPVLGTYPVTLVINPQGNCPQTLTREVAVAPRPTGDFSWARLACTRTWRFTANMPLANHFTWYLDGQQVGTGPTLDLDFPQGGNYSMRLRGSSLPTACYHEAILTVPIAVPVNAQIGASVPECSDELLLQSTGSGQVVSWLWEVDGVAYSTSELRITFIPNSTLPIRLLLEDVDGCTYQADTLLRLGPGRLAALRVPNVFSPNNDGVNDLWQPETNNADCLERLQVFNRWGVQVFETPQPTQGWDGRYQDGKAAPEGVYVFILRLRDGNERTGTLTLVR